MIDLKQSHLCPDCTERKPVPLIFDLKYDGEVCPNCERIFSPNNPHNNFGYVTKAACLRAMAKFQKEKARRTSEFTTALMKSIREN